MKSAPVELPATTPAVTDSPKFLTARVNAALRRWLDGLFRAVCQAAAWLIVVKAVLLVMVLVWQARLAIQTLGLDFFCATTWDPEPTHRRFGALSFIYGTLATSAIAMVLAVPLGIATAAFLSEIAGRWLRRTGSTLVEMLAAIPSVVYGFWGLFFLAPLLQKTITAMGGPNQGGVGIVPAGVLLSIMILPYITAVSFNACQAVPRSQREAALALGATRWQTIRSVVVPYARPGIVAGCLLALGRAMGETMAVTMMIGNRSAIELSPFALGNSIASVIANEFTEAAYDLYLSALVELGLVLLVLTMIVNSGGRLLIRRLGRHPCARPVMLSATCTTPVELRARSTSPSETTTARLQQRHPVRLPPPSVKANTVDRLMTGVLAMCLVWSIGPLFLILAHLVYHGLGSISWEFFVNLPAPVGERGGGMANAIYGSLMLVCLAVAFAVPVGFLAAVYLAEYRSQRLAPAVRFIAELQSGVPSIVIGIFAYHLVVRPMGHFSGWAGAFALGMMMIPIVLRASEEALKQVPQSLRDASYALGASRFQTALRVVVPAAMPAIITAIFLAIARIAGETAPLLLTAAGNQFWPVSPSDFVPSLPVYIFNYAVSPYEEWHRQAWAAALVLLVAVMLLNVGVRLAAGKRGLLIGQVR